MVFRKHNQTDGFSLIEVLVSITLLGLVVVPIGSALLLSARLNVRSDDVLQAQLAVSSAVETIMAEGYNEAWNQLICTDESSYRKRFGTVTVSGEPSDNTDHPLYYALMVYDGSSKEDACTIVETYVKPYEGGDAG